MNKQPSNSDDASKPPYVPVDETPIAAVGFARIADYPAFALYEGPQAAVAALIAALTDIGYVAATTTDMDQIQLLGHTVDADTGIAAPPYADETVAQRLLQPGSRSYLIVLRGYPVEEWLDDLTSRGVAILEPLPPAAYIIHAIPEVAGALLADTTYTRGVFPMLPAMKVEPLTQVESAADLLFIPISIEAYEPSDAESIEPFLESVAQPGTLAVINRTGARVQYTATLTAVDTSTLSHFEALIVASPVPEVGPSSERQGMLVAAPHFGAGSVISIPAAVEFGGYTNYLAAPQYGKNITDFVNTKAAMLDTGFDEGVATVHPDFTCPAGKPNCTAGQSYIITSLSGVPLNQTNDPNVDDSTHGTISASIVAGFPPSGSSRWDSGSYRYGLGLAPSMTTAVDKFLSFTRNYPPGDSLSRLTNP